MNRRKKRPSGGKGYGLAWAASLLALAALVLCGWWMLPAGVDPALAVAGPAALFPVGEPQATPFPGGPDPASDPQDLQDPQGTQEGQTALSPEEELYQTVYSAVNELQQTVSVTSGDKEALREVLARILHRPEFFWLDGYNTQSMGDEHQVTFQWKYSDLETKRAQVEQAALRALEAVPAGAGEYETALTIHDWLCENIVYEFSSDGSDQDLYGALVNGRCVCAGYSAAYEYLLTRAGLQAETVRGMASSDGTTEAHAWSKVQLEGDTYYIDVTWDDNEDGYDHFWFGLTSTRMGITHFADESQGAAMTPSSAVACNYYRRNGMTLDLFSEEKLVQLLQAQAGPQFFVCASDQDTFDQLKALFDGQSIYALLEQAGHPAGGLEYSFIDGALGLKFTLR